MEKSEIWHDIEEEPTKIGVRIGLLNMSNEIDYICWKGCFYMRDYHCYGYKAWAYADDIVNL